MAYRNYKRKSWNALFGNWDPYKAPLRGLKQKLSYYNGVLDEFDYSIVRASEDQLEREMKIAESEWSRLSDEIAGHRGMITELQNKIGFIGSFFNTENTQRIRWEIRNLENTIKNKTPNLDNKYEIYKRKRDVYNAKKSYLLCLQKIEIIKECIEEAERKNDKERRIKNELAKSVQEKRHIANEVKVILRKNRICPYCGEIIDYNNGLAHADHIYPIAKGGQSTVRNMIYICKDCNLRKGTLTLNQFIKKYDLDREAIEDNLTKMHKDF